MSGGERHGGEDDDVLKLGVRNVNVVAGEGFDQLSHFCFFFFFLNPETPMRTAYPDLPPWERIWFIMFYRQTYEV